ncbi:MAG: sialidase family protein [Polyangiaceae bacterium]
MTPAPQPTAASVTPPALPNAPAIVMLAGSRSRTAASTGPFAGRGVVAPSNESLAKWVEPALDEDAPNIWEQTVAAGARAAILRRGDALYVAHLDRGVTGPIALPQRTFWVGLDEADALYAARSDGTLLRVNDLAKVTDAGNFEPIVSIPSAVAWDVTEGRIVAAGGAFAFVSSDGGASFQASPLPARESAEQIVARPDGVVAVLSHADGDARSRAVWISNDGARTFHASHFPARSLRRIGARILGEGDGCEARLATDGRTWNAGEERDDTWRLEHGWSRMLGVWSQAGGNVPSRLLTLREPAAPSPSSTRIDEQGLCPAKPPKGKGGGSGDGVLGALGRGGIGLRTGAMQLLDARSPSIPRTRTAWGFLGDGTCDAGDVVTQWKTDDCRADRPLTRAPRIARTDAETLGLQVMDAPPGCDEKHLFNARGTAALLCKSGATDRAVYFAGRDGRWYAEGTVTCAKDARLFEVKEDGTLAIACDLRSDGGRALWVRRPASIGTKDAFRKVDVEGALAYRLLDGGRVAIVTSKGKDDAWGGFGLGGLGGSGSLGTIGVHKGASSKQGTSKDTSPKQGTSKDASPKQGTSGKAPAKPAGTVARGESIGLGSIGTLGRGKGSGTGFGGASKKDPAAERARHTFSVTIDAPDTAPTVAAKDLYTTEDVAGIASTETRLYFRLETPAHAPLAKPNARFVLLDGGKLKTVPAKETPEELRDDEPLAVFGRSYSFGMAAPGGLAADSTHVYWADTEAGTILRAPKAGGKAEIVTSGLAGPLAVAVDEARVYFTTIGKRYGDPGAVGYAPKSGGEYMVLKDGLFRPVAVAVDAGAVYWLVQGHEQSTTGYVFKTPKNGSAPAILAHHLVKPEAMTLAGGSLFVGSGWGEVVRVPVDGSPATYLGGRGAEVPALAVTGDAVLWPAGGEPAIASMPVSGGPVSIAVRTSLSVTALAADGKDLWLLALGTNELARAKGSSGKAEILTGDLTSPSAVLADETGSYVRENDGARLRRIPPSGGKPTTLYDRKTD